MKCINIFGGPGVGKSTLSAGLFYKMKKLGYSVEYSTEYAKDLVYEENTFQLKDQLLVLANQHNRLWKLKNKVDYVINDGPFLLSTIYYDYNTNPNLPKSEFCELILKMFNTYDNVNIFLNRNYAKNYEIIGRSESVQESLLIHEKIKSLLTENSIKYTSINSEEQDSINKILKLINIIA